MLTDLTTESESFWTEAAIICLRALSYGMITGEGRRRNFNLYIQICGPGISVGIATEYGLDGPGSNPGGDEIFRPSRPVLGPTQPPVQWVPSLSRGKRAAGACW